MRDAAERLAATLSMKLKDSFIKVETTDAGLDEGSIKRIRTALSPIFLTEVKKELLLKNLVANATTPSKGEVTEKEFLDAEQCKELLGFVDEVSNLQVARAIKRLLFTGMRVGELTALHWEEVDMESCTLVVKYNLYRLNGEYRLTSPKTKSSARLITLPP